MKRIPLTIFLFSLIIYGCNTKSIRQERMRGATVSDSKSQPDSFLYYQPRTIPNTFLDNLKIANDKPVSLDLTLYPPPPPPPPKFRQQPGFRIQTFAGVDSLSTLMEMIKIQNSVSDSVYFFKENNLFKVQFGDYINRNKADLKVLDIRKNGISGAWVVQTMINIKTQSDSDSTASINTQPLSENLPFKIQVLVTSSEIKAEETVNILKDIVSANSYYKSSNNLYKVFVGNFKDRESASKSLKIIKTKGFKDAWLVY